MQDRRREEEGRGREQLEEEAGREGRHDFTKDIWVGTIHDPAPEDRVNHAREIEEYERTEGEAEPSEGPGRGRAAGRASRADRMFGRDDKDRGIDREV